MHGAGNPRLVYASVSGFGQTGPWRRRPAYDTVVQAAAGLCRSPASPDGAPVKPGTSIADLSAGLYAFGAILAALRGRDHTGAATHVDIAMYDAARLAARGRRAVLPGHRTASRRGIGNAHYSISPFDTFHCADRAIIICAANDGLFGVLCTVLGRPELVDDPRFADNDNRAEPEGAGGELESALRTAPAAEWLERSRRRACPCNEVVDGRARRWTPSRPRPGRWWSAPAGCRWSGNPMKISAWPDPAERPARPELDEHGAALRAELGL